MARTFTYLFGTGATLVLISLLLPHSPDRDTTGLVIAMVAAYAVALGFLIAFDRLPLWVFEASPLVGTAVVSLAVYFGGSQAAAAISNARTLGPDLGYGRLDVYKAIEAAITMR